MSWKDKFFTLINTRFYTKEEIDSKATVVFIGYKNFILNYNEKRFEPCDINLSYDPNIAPYVLVMELPFGGYGFEAISDNSANMIQDETGGFEVNQKFMIVDFYRYIGESHE